MTIQEQFEKEFQPSGLAAASIEHFLKTGKVSGSLHVFLQKQSEEFYNAGLMCERILHPKTTQINNFQG